MSRIDLAAIDTSDTGGLTEEQAQEELAELRERLADLQDRLFADQPAEGGAGLSDEQLIGFGRDLGADLTACVTGGAYTADIAAVTAAALATPAARNADGQFGTPTVLLNGARVDITDTEWLQRALAA